MIRLVLLSSMLLVACGSSPCKVLTPTFSAPPDAHANTAVMLEFDAVTSGECGPDGPDFISTVTDDNFGTHVAETDLSRDTVGDTVVFHGKVHTQLGDPGDYVLDVNVSSQGTALADGTQVFTVAP